MLNSPSILFFFCIIILIENTQNKRTGILKTQSYLDKKDKTSNNDTRKQNRQNVALQTILKRNQEQEHKQVPKCNLLNLLVTFVYVHSTPILVCLILGYFQNTISKLIHLQR